MDKEPQIGWVGALLTGLAIGVAGGLIALHFFEHPVPDPYDYLSLLPAAAAGVTAAFVERGLGLGHRLWRGWATEDRFFAGLVLGAVAGFLAGSLVAMTAVNPSPHYHDDAEGLIFIAIVIFVAPLAAVLCPFLWSGWLAWRRRKQTEVGA